MDQTEQKNREWQTYYNCANSAERRKEKKHRPQAKGHVNNDDGRMEEKGMNGIIMVSTMTKTVSDPQ